jgi:hypothetical protein
MGQPRLETPSTAAELAERLALLSRGQRQAFDLIRKGEGAKANRQKATVLYNLGLIERYQYPSSFATTGEKAGYFVTGRVSIQLHELVL